MAEETSEYLGELCARMMPCAGYDALNDVLSQEEIERALARYPEPTNTLLLYAANRERIALSLPDMPAWALTWKKVDSAALRLSFIYLRRLGFLSEFREIPKGGIVWGFNFNHPSAKTMARLKKRHLPLYRAALTAWKRHEELLGAGAGLS